MQQSSENLSNTAYFEGLRDADPGVVQAIYHEMRLPVTRAVEAAGGSHADGATFFRVAIFQVAELARDNNFEKERSLVELLKSLAVVQYRDWLTEREQEIPYRESLSTEWTDVSMVLPSVELMRQLRQRIRARRQFPRLEAGCQRSLRALATNNLEPREPVHEEENKEVPAPDICVEKYKSLLAQDGGNWDFVTPGWVAGRLNDTQFDKLWNAVEAMESRLAVGQPLSGEAQPKDNITRYVLIGLALLLVASLAWRYFFRSKTPEEVYADNFNPPSSIIADMEARATRDSVTNQMPALCERYMREADAYYTQKSWRESLDVMAMVLDDTLTECHSDALYYMGLVGLQIEEPELTLECFSKIEDIERFGEDIYWYQALAFVQKAAQNPLQRDLARRAVERARSNTEIPERKIQAEKMLEQLGE